MLSVLVVKLSLPEVLAPISILDLLALVLRLKLMGLSLPVLRLS